MRTDTLRTKPNSHTGRAYDLLKTKILTGVLRPGEWLSASTLSKEIGISRTPIREAFHELENDGLVTMLPKLGAMVTQLDYEQFRELLGYRKALEMHAAEEAADIRQPSDLADLEHSVEMMRRDLAADAAAATTRLLEERDAQFHRILVKIPRNTLVAQRFERILVLLRLVVCKPNTPAHILREESERGVEEHASIIEALRARDRERARQLIRQHLDRIAGRVLSDLVLNRDAMMLAS
ncbi:MAG TPA: GntR family transcriptional regulator [Terrimicrobiaceae bacterium]|nr:GntR family transcriptional regulator [Terrimicrobiaceae bacterium]